MGSTLYPGSSSVVYPPNTVETPAITGAGTHQFFITHGGSTGRTITQIAVMLQDATITANDTNYIEWAFEVRSADGITQLYTENVQTKTVGSGGIGDMAAYEFKTVTVDWAVPAYGLIFVTLSRVGTATCDVGMCGVQ